MFEMNLLKTQGSKTRTELQGEELINHPGSMPSSQELIYSRLVGEYRKINNIYTYIYEHMAFLSGSTQKLPLSFCSYHS